jgi:hypothetical protein
MRIFTIFILLPALVALLVLSLFDKQRGDGRLWRAVLTGSAAGLIAAASYDLFRLPFVFAKEWGIASIVPPMNLFKVFPGFGAMILGQPVGQGSYSLAAVLLGWLYHFSNGLTFGVMYIAMVGDPAQRHWAWAVLMALVLELGMLLTPYPRVFNIAVTSHFVMVTAAAHGIFGLTMGILARRFANWSRD